MASERALMDQVKAEGMIAEKRKPAIHSHDCSFFDPTGWTYRISLISRQNPELIRPAKPALHRINALRKMAQHAKTMLFRCTLYLNCSIRTCRPTTSPDSCFRRIHSRTHPAYSVTLKLGSPVAFKARISKILESGKWGFSISS
jgi:hypothetical protein